MASLVWGKAQQLSFFDEHEYYQALGSLCRDECYSISYETNKKTHSWGNAYRIRCYKANDEIPNAFVEAMKSGRRINCNDYVENLVNNHDFDFDHANRVLKGDFNKVKNTIPPEYADDFINGYNLIFSTNASLMHGEGETSPSVPNVLDDFIPEEVREEDAKNIFEGAKKTITVNSYERDQNAKRICKNHYMKKYGRIVCQICGFDFGKVYGPEYENKIHIHHVIPLSEIGAEYIVDPIKDLIPVCPNCHLVIHAGKDISIENLKRRMRFFYKNFFFDDSKEM